ncbi:MAG: hypothetical protein QOH36_1269 [Actinomycetota bacterium]|nr:hypothetical protein [Actinomycetota bacterium]
MKTLAIRLDDEVAAQLAVVAQLEDTSLVELIRQAVAQLLAAKSGDQALSHRATDILAEIDQDAASRKAAIAALFGTAAPVTDQAPPAESPASSAKGRTLTRGSGGQGSVEA